MFPRTGRKDKNQTENENIHAKAHDGGISGLNLSIGNQALIENYAEFLESQNDLLPDPGKGTFPEPDLIPEMAPRRINPNAMGPSSGANSESLRIEYKKMNHIGEDSGSGELSGPQKTKKRPGAAQGNPIMTADKKPFPGGMPKDSLPLIREAVPEINDLITNNITGPSLSGMPENDHDLKNSISGDRMPFRTIQERIEGRGGIEEYRKSESEDEKSADDDDSENSLIIDTRREETKQRDREAKRRKAAARGAMQRGNVPVQEPVQAIPGLQDQNTDSMSTYAEEQEPDLIAEPRRKLKRKKGKKLPPLLKKGIVGGLEALNPDKKWKDESLAYARKINDTRNI